jgi:hypothetical protein
MMEGSESVKIITDPDSGGSKPYGSYETGFQWGRSVDTNPGKVK